MQDKQRDSVSPPVLRRNAPPRFYLLAVLLCLLPPLAARAQPPATLFAYVGDSSHSAHFGALQGLQEANIQGRFLGQSYELHNHLPGVDPGTLLNEGAPPVAFFAVLDQPDLLSLADAFPNLPVFNLSLDADELRAACAPNNLLHIVPSQGMKQDAVEQWYRAHPVSPEQPQESIQALAWHPDFLKFAARDLNKRFRKAFNMPMDDASWAGWAALRIAAEALGRERLSAPGALLDYLRTRLSFDGQKGVPMSFRSTGQLRQPLLLQRAGELIGEAPVRGIAQSSELDSLGLPACP